MRWLLLLGVLSACSKVVDDDDEPKLSHRSRDAGPAVVFVDRAQTAGGVAAIDEKEPNDRGSAGQALSLPGAVRGRIDVAGDWDVYEVKVPRAGTLAVRLSAVEDADLILEVKDESGATLATSDDGPAKTAEALPNVFVQPGTYQIVIHEFVKKDTNREKREKKEKTKDKETAPPSRTQPSAVYELTVDLGPTPEVGEERERNDEAAFADPLALGQAGRGFVGWRKDVDVWKISLEGARADEVLSVDVTGVPGVALRLALQDATGKTLLERKGRTGQPLSAASVAVPAQTPFVFALVSGDTANADERYTISAQVRAAQLDEESEPNDTPETASPLADVPGAESGTRVGTLAGTDVDMFRLDPAPGARSLSVTVEPPAGLDVEVTLLGAGGRVLLGPVDSAKKGGAEKIVAAPVAPDAPVFVRVRSKGGAATEAYKLRWSVGAAAAATPVPGIDE
jgi:hypothetical protein